MTTAKGKRQGTAERTPRAPAATVPTHGPEPEQRLTIDQLALAAGLTVRNVRNYQSRGLIAPPEVQGRVGYYGAEHLAGLHLIRELQAQGFNLAAIAHMLEDARGVGEEVLGFTRSLMAPFETETPEVLERADLAERLGGALDGGFVAKRLVALGVPLDAVLDMMAKLKRDIDRIANGFVQIFLEYVWKPFADSGRPDADWPRVRATLDQLRPLAAESLTAAFAPTMTKAVEVAFGKEIDRGRARRA
jgi:DNA-binding transcriptional MerR regulator